MAGLPRPSALFGMAEGIVGRRRRSFEHENATASFPKLGGVPLAAKFGEFLRLMVVERDELVASGEMLGRIDEVQAVTGHVILFQSGRGYYASTGEVGRSPEHRSATGCRLADVDGSPPIEQHAGKRDGRDPGTRTSPAARCC